MAFFFAYGTELDRAGLLTRALTGKTASPRVAEAVHVEGVADANAQHTSAEPSGESYDEYATRQPIAAGYVEGAMMVFRERKEGLGGPVPDLRDEASAKTWGVLFEVSDNTVRALCLNFDIARECVIRDVRIAKPLTGSASATFDVAGSVDQTVTANCLIAKNHDAPLTSLDEPLMRKLLGYYLAHEAPAATLLRLIPRRACKVDDIERGKDDLAERVICEIYYKARPNYAIYRSSERVMVQYADDGVKDPSNPNASLADTQRAKMACLNPLRSQITGLIDGWEKSRNPRLAERARRYNARVAAALNQCLEGDSNSPMQALTEVRDEIAAERASWGRFLYLSSALAVAAAFCAAFWIIKAHVFGPTHPTAALWLAARAGTIGAFFSIAMNIQQRKVLTDLLTRDNIADAALRITVGAIGAGALLCLLQSGITPLANFGNATLAGTAMGWQVILVIGFAAGFSERLVPTIVEKIAAQNATTPAAKTTGKTT